MKKLMMILLSLAISPIAFAKLTPDQDAACARFGNAGMRGAPIAQQLELSIEAILLVSEFAEKGGNAAALRLAISALIKKNPAKSDDIGKMAYFVCVQANEESDKATARSSLQNLIEMHQKGKL